MIQSFGVLHGILNREETSKITTLRFAHTLRYLQTKFLKAQFKAMRLGKESADLEAVNILGGVNFNILEQRMINNIINSLQNEKSSSVFSINTGEKINYT